MRWNSTVGDKNYQMGFASSYQRASTAWLNQNEIGIRSTKKFENMLYEKIQELEIKLEHSNTAREKEVLINVIATPGYVVVHLFDLKSGGDDIQAIEIAEPNNNFQGIQKIIFSYNFPKFWQ
jgi:hypothetical protein